MPGLPVSSPSSTGGSPKSALAHALDVAVFGPVGLAANVVSHLPEWVEKGRDEVFHQLDVARVVGEHASRHGQKRLKSALVGMGILPGPLPPSAPRAAETGGPAATAAGRAAPGGHRDEGAGRSGAGRSGDEPGSALRPSAEPESAEPGSAMRPGDERRSASASGAASERATRHRTRQEASPQEATPQETGPQEGVRLKDAELEATAHSAPSEGSDGEHSPEGADLAIPGYDSLSAFQVVQRLAGLEPAELESVRRYETTGRGRRTILTRISQLQTGRP
ncbi:MAG: hypothetical protein ACRDZ8_08115 [Acidimicrobiales bacterium]